MTSCVLGFNGERLDPINGATHLGNGYRAYNPALMRFNSPDGLSPFGAGGINPYVYCAGDPVNHADPSGHLSWQAWLGIGMGIVGLGLAVFTAGASIAAMGSIMGAIESTSVVSLVVGAAGVVSDVTAIASGATEEINPQASSTLGWVSLILGAAGMAHGLYEGGKAAYRGISKLTPARRTQVFTLGNAQRTLNLRLVQTESEITREELTEGSSMFYRYKSKPDNDTAIFVSHSRFQPHRYLSRTAHTELPEGVTLNHFVRHGEPMSSTDAMRTYSRLQNLTRAGGLDAISYVGPRQVKNYTINPIHENLLLRIGKFDDKYSHHYPYDLIVPAIQSTTDDLISLIKNNNYNTLYVIGCRVYRFSSNGII